MRIPAACAIVGSVLLLGLASAAAPAQTPAGGGGKPVPSLFVSADRCQGCHNGIVTPAGRDVSLGVEWRSSMMAHAARDPYWHAGVRREVLDHPKAAAAIENECSRCHMPMANVPRAAAGGTGQVFALLPGIAPASAEAALAADGVSCSVCHQITPDRLGTPESFTGHFGVDTTTPPEQRPMYGPFSVDRGRQRLMHSATGFTPTEGTHVQSSEVCATCHTLYTHALDADGRAIGSLPEQVPYLEWRHSAYRTTQSCQACHMPTLTEQVPISSTLGEPRDGFSRHSFVGSNFWMLEVLERHGREVGVAAVPGELHAAAEESRASLARDAASLDVTDVKRGDGRLRFAVTIANAGGHKLPTAYPSRRVWLHVRVTDATNAVVFESGAVEPNGAIVGNDNDRDASVFEPHHLELTSADQVQIYENIMLDARGAVTTGLLSGVRYVKDNRLLPRGFDKATAEADIAVHGEAAADADFSGGSDVVRYSVPVPGEGPFTVSVELLYQSVGYRWAQNLRTYRSPETDRFGRFYDSLSHVTTARLALATAAVK